MKQAAHAVTFPNFIRGKWEGRGGVRISTKTPTILIGFYQTFAARPSQEFQIATYGSYLAHRHIRNKICTEWPKKMYTLFTHQYLWNKFKRNFYFRVRV